MNAAIAEPIGFASIAQVLGGLLVVLLVLGGCVLLLKRMGSLTRTGGRLLRIVEALPLGPRDRIVLLEVEGRRLLVGISPGRISPLADFGAADASFDTALTRSVQELQVAK